MGGPTRESCLAAQKAWQERRDTLRTRGGVVALAEWQAALRAPRTFVKLMGHPPWLLDVRLALAPDVGFELRLTLITDPPEGRPLPTAVDDVPVRVIVKNPRGMGRG